MLLSIYTHKTTWYPYNLLQHTPQPLSLELALSDWLRVFFAPTRLRLRVAGLLSCFRPALSLSCTVSLYFSKAPTSIEEEKCGAFSLGKGVHKRYMYVSSSSIDSEERLQRAVFSALKAENTAEKFSRLPVPLVRRRSILDSPCSEKREWLLLRPKPSKIIARKWNERSNIFKLIHNYI